MENEQDTLKKLKDRLVNQHLEDFGTHVSVNILLAKQGEMTQEEAWNNMEKFYDRMMDKIKKL